MSCKKCFSASNLTQNVIVRNGYINTFSFNPYNTTDCEVKENYDTDCEHYDFECDNYNNNCE